MGLPNSEVGNSTAAQDTSQAAVGAAQSAVYGMAAKRSRAVIVSSRAAPLGQKGSHKPTRQNAAAFP